MAAATGQGTYINPMAALAAGQLPHALNGMQNSVVPPTSGNLFHHLVLFKPETSFSLLRFKLFCNIFTLKSLFPFDKVYFLIHNILTYKILIGILEYGNEN